MKPYGPPTYSDCAPCPHVLVVCKLHETFIRLFAFFLPLSLLSFLSLCYVTSQNLHFLPPPPSPFAFLFCLLGAFVCFGLCVCVVVCGYPFFVSCIEMQLMLARPVAVTVEELLYVICHTGEKHPNPLSRHLLNRTSRSSHVVFHTFHPVFFCNSPPSRRPLMFGICRFFLSWFLTLSAVLVFRPRYSCSLPCFACVVSFSSFSIFPFIPSLMLPHFSCLAFCHIDDVAQWT